jgi:hypothetical protein
VGSFSSPLGRGCRLMNTHYETTAITGSSRAEGVADNRHSDPATSGSLPLLPYDSETPELFAFRSRITDCRPKDPSGSRRDTFQEAQVVDS